MTSTMTEAIKMETTEINVEDVIKRLTTSRMRPAQARRYQRFIGAPDTLRDATALLEVSANMLPILEWVQQIDPKLISKQDFKLLTGVAEVICHQTRDSLHGGRPPTGMRDPFYGLYTTHALFSALGAAPDETHLQERYIVLQAQTLVSVRRLDTVVERNQPVAKTCYRGCLRARQLSSETLGGLLRELPADPGPTEAYIDQLRDIQERVPPAMRPVARELRRLLEGGIEEEGDSKGRRSSRGPRGSALVPRENQAEIRTHWHTMFPIDGDDTPAGHVLFGETDTRSAETERRSEAEGDAPNERVVRQVGIQVHEAAAPEHSRGAADAAIRTQGFVAAIAKTNQALVIDLDVLPLREIAILIAELERLGRTDGDGKIPLPTLTALAGVLLWTGFGLDTTLDVELRDRWVEPQTDGPPILVLDADWDRTRWLYRVRKIKRTGNHPLTRDRRPQTLVLPVADTLARLQHRYLRSRGLDVSNGLDEPRVRLFARAPGCRSLKRSSEVYEAELRHLLSVINRKHRTHLTVRRLEWCLDHILTNRTYADRVDARLLTGKSRALATNDAYYIRRPRESLYGLYNDARAVLAEAAKRAHVYRTGSRKSPQKRRSTNPDLFRQATARSSLRQSGVGSPFCPELADVRGFSNALREKLRQAKMMPPGKSGLITLHNAMTCYSLMLCAFGLGFRAVGHPLKGWTDLDEQTGLVVLLDKDYGDGYGARIVWAPHVVRTQLQHYRHHVLVLAERLGFLEPTLQERISHALALENAPTQAEWLQPFFLLDWKSRPVRCSPSQLNPHLPHFGPAPHEEASDASERPSYPLNACRHFVASQLRERGVSEDVVCAYMGHWQLGEEPWASRSALSPLEYVSALAPVLTAVMAETGWQPQHGLGAR